MDVSDSFAIAESGDDGQMGKFEEYQLSTILDTVGDPVFFVDGQGFISGVNEAAQGILNLHFPAGEPEYFEDGKLVNFNSQTYVVTRRAVAQNGGTAGAIVIWRNVTELKKAEEAYRDLDIAVRASYDGIFVSDAKGNTIRFNAAYCRITGISAEEIKDLNVFEIASKNTSESVFLKALEARETVTAMPVFKTGKKALITATPVLNEEGEIIRVVANYRDITELITLNSQLEKARELSERYYSEILQLRSQQAEIQGFIIESRQMKELISTALKVGHTNATVLITGDSGVGKEVLARVVHNNSDFKQGTFVKINCGAIPDNLLESELFGYEKGAFTGAAKHGKPGLFEVAAGGTVFLDEIGEMPLNLQVKLLGVLQDLNFYRVGGLKPIPLNSRIIAATNRDLEEMVNKGEFRKDLYYRLHVVSLRIPPLTERKDDILPLAKHFLEKFNCKYTVNNTLSQQVLNAFFNYDWPGNVRELENLIETLVVMSPNEQITPAMLPDTLRQATSINERMEGTTYEQLIERMEYKLFKSLLDKGYSTRKISKELDISQPTVVRKINKLGLNRKEKFDTIMNR